MAKLLKSCCEDVGGAILFWQSSGDKRMKGLIIHIQMCLWSSSNFSNTVFSHKFLREIIKLGAKLVMNIKLYFHLSFRGSSFSETRRNSISLQNENINSLFQVEIKQCVTKGLCQSWVYTYASCAAGHLFYMHLNEKTLLALGWVRTDYDCMVLGAR